MKNTKLYLYEFDIREFSLQDQNAGYFTSETTQYPFAKFEIENLLEEVKVLNWSICRMRFAQLRK